MSEIDEGLIGSEEVVTRTRSTGFAPAADSKWAILMLARRRRARVDRAEPGSDGFLSFIWRLVDLIQLGLFLGAIGSDRLQRHRVADRRVRRDDLAGPRPRGPAPQAKHGHAALTSSDRRPVRKSRASDDPRLRQLRIITACGDAGEDNFTSMKGVERSRRRSSSRSSAPLGPARARGSGQPTPPGTAPRRGRAAPAQDPMTASTSSRSSATPGAITDAEFEAKKADPRLSRI